MSSFKWGKERRSAWDLFPKTGTTTSDCLSSSCSIRTFPCNYCSYALSFNDRFLCLCPNQKKDSTGDMFPNNSMMGLRLTSCSPVTGGTRFRLSFSTCSPIDRFGGMSSSSQHRPFRVYYRMRDHPPKPCGAFVDNSSEKGAARATREKGRANQQTTSHRLPFPFLFGRRATTD